MPRGGLLERETFGFGSLNGSAGDSGELEVYQNGSRPSTAWRVCFAQPEHFVIPVGILSERTKMWLKRGNATPSVDRLNRLA
jgi:hypothetical protein